MHILQNKRFLAYQGLPLRGRNVDTDSNFIQLSRLYSVDADVDTWLSKKSNKYTSHEIQDIILKEMVHKTLYDIGQNIHDGGLFSIMADERRLLKQGTVYNQYSMGGFQATRSH